MKPLVMWLLVGLVLLNGQAFGYELYGGRYETIFPAKVKRLTPAVHYCFPHCATRTVQETRVTCSLGEPTEVELDVPIPDELRAVWVIHEENWLLEERVDVNLTCQELVTPLHATQLTQPQYWSEDDIWNPVSYYDTPLYQFNCGNLQYDPQANQTETFIYRIVVGYRIGC